MRDAGCEAAGAPTIATIRRLYGPARLLPMSDRLPVSAVIITLNAASQLESCLESVQFCADIVVVDSGSTDGTQALAQRYGARVIQCEWRGFGPQKQFAVDQAQHDWVLCVDADERVSPELEASNASSICTPLYGAYRVQ